MSGSPNSVLPDGRYDVFVVDAARAADCSPVRLWLTVLAGPHKGEVVEVLAADIDADELDLLGLPATLDVRGGSPRVCFDD